MATLDRVGQRAVENHHQQVPFHPLKNVPEASVGASGAGNLIVEGDKDRERGRDAASAVDAMSSSRSASHGSSVSSRGGDAASTEDAASARGAAPTSAPKTYFDPSQPVGFLRGGNLPHWRQQSATYFITWRTADSMPEERVRIWLAEREAWLSQHPAPHDDAAKAEYDRLFSERWELWLDECRGACELRRAELKVVVAGALRHYDGERYRLQEFVVMPNHVHVLVSPQGEHTLSEIVQNWKSYTAHAVNGLLGRKGTFWQKESFDHIVRNANEMERIRAYIRAQEVDATSPSRSSARGVDAASTKGAAPTR